MRSLLISGTYFPPQVGGISTMMAEVCRHLGPDRISALTGDPHAAPDDGEPGRVQVRRTASLPLRGLAGAPRFAFELNAQIRRHKPHHLIFATLEDGYAAYVARRVARLPQVFFAHGNEILEALEPRWDKPRNALLTAERVLAVSGYTASLLRRAGVAPERIEVLHPGCDTERFRRVDVSTAELDRYTRGRATARRLLTVGNLVERKGHDMVIRAVAALQGRPHDLVYLIAGDGPHRGALEKLAFELGVADRVVFLGRVDAHELPLLYSAADLFVMVSRERAQHHDVEGFGIVFIEAAACGAAVIGGRSGGIGDALVDGVTGLLVEPDEPAAVAATIDKLLSDRDLAARLGRAGAASAHERFSWARFARGLDTVLQKVAEEGRR